LRFHSKGLESQKTDLCAIDDCYPYRQMKLDKYLVSVANSKRSEPAIEHGVYCPCLTVSSKQWFVTKLKPQEYFQRSNENSSCMVSEKQ